MALKKFYKSAGNVWVVGGFDAVPVGLFIRRIDTVTGIIYINVWDAFEKNRAPIAQGTYDEFCDEQGVAYTSLAAFKTATDEFFIGSGVQVLDNISEGTPVNAVAASRLLTVADTPHEGDTVTMGGKTYKARLTALGAGVAAYKVLTLNSNPLEGDTITIGAKTYKVRRTALGAGVAASAVLTNNQTAPTDGDTVTVGTRVYTFKDIMASANDVKIGTASASVLSLFKAMHLTGTVGVDYFTGTAAINVNATAIHTTEYVITVTADAVGFAGNSFAKAATGAVNDWDGSGAVFTGGIDPQAANDVYLSASGTDASITNLLVAVNTGYSAGVTGTGTTANATVTATKDSTTELRATAKAVGYAGNSIVVGEALDDGASVWAGGATALSGGIDAQAANDVYCTTAETFINNLVTAVNAGYSAGITGTGTVANALVTATKVDASTMTATNKIKGIIGNSSVIGQVSTHFSWTGGAVLLAGGVDGTIAATGKQYFDDTYQYLTVAANTIADANWVRAAIGTTY